VQSARVGQTQPIAHPQILRVALCMEISSAVFPAHGPAAQPQDAVGRDAALEEGVKLVLDELRQAGASGLFGLGEEGLGMLLQQALKRGLLGAVARAMDRVRHQRYTNTRLMKLPAARRQAAQQGLGRSPGSGRSAEGCRPKVTQALKSGLSSSRGKRR